MEFSDPASLARAGARRHLRFASLLAYIAAMDLKFCRRRSARPSASLMPLPHAGRWTPQRRS